MLSPGSAIPLLMCCVLVFVFLIQATSRPQPLVELNDRPVVGVLSQEYFGSFRDYNEQKSYIAASYVKSLESAGARVVPILLDRHPEYYANLIQNLNGILFPGGGQNLLDSGFSRTGRILYEAVKQLNDKGDYFPLWATCLGFELLFVLENGTFVFTRCDAYDMGVPIDFSVDFDELRAKSKIFQGITAERFQTMKTQNVTYNYHKWCLTKETFDGIGMNDQFNIFAWNRDKHGLEYVSIVESKKYPIYGVQFHPEKSQFEFIVKPGHRNVPHTSDAIRTGQHFANFFVDDCRKNRHNFDASAGPNVTLIYNFTAEYTASASSFEQMYFFDL